MDAEIPPSVFARADSDERAARVEIILQQLDALPTLSPIATRLMSAAVLDQIEVDEVVSIIESDPGLTARILGLCRRADRGLGDAIQTVRHAVVMLGLEAVQSAVLSVQVYELMGERAEESAGDDEGSDFDRVGLWTHTLAVACAAEMIATEHRTLGVKPDRAFVAGMLHDLGKSALQLVLPRSYGRVLRIAEDRQSDAAPIERRLIGLDHFTAGRRIAERWGLGEVLGDVIWLHAQPGAAIPEVPHKPLIGLVTLAKTFARRQHLGWSGEYGEPMELEDAAGALGLRADAVERLGPKLIDRVTDRCATLGINAGTGPELLLESIATANRRLASLNNAMRRRANEADRAKSVLAEIDRFHSTWHAQESVTGTMGLVAASAERVLGEGFYAGVFQASAGAPWRGMVFNSGGTLARQGEVQAPAEGSGSLAALCGGGQITMRAAEALRALHPFLHDAPDAAEVRVLPLMSAEAPSAGPVAVLLHAGDDVETIVGTAGLPALVAAWTAAVMAAARHEHARRLGEQLAEANRELGEAQREITEQASLVRLGEMSAGAAHEMNNPLTVIRGRSQMLAEHLDRERDRAAAAAIAQAAGELTNLITSLHLLADPPKPEREPISIALVVRDAIERARAQIPQGTVRLNVGLQEHETSPPVLADPDLLATGLAEIVKNALEANPGGEVAIAIEVARTKDRLVVKVTDTGPGLSERALRHAFDPFFSELPAGRRPGLGLARARMLVGLHDGEILLGNTHGDGYDDDEPTGAMMRVILPIAGAERHKPRRHAA